VQVPPGPARRSRSVPPRAWLYALGAYLAVYAALLAALHRFEGFDLLEPLFVLGVYGVAFTSLAWWSTRGLEPRDVHVRRPRTETTFVLLYFLVLVLFITFGFDVVRGWSQEESLQKASIIVAKLVSFVLVPFLLMRGIFGYGVRDFVDWRSALRGHWRPLVVIGIALVVFQLVFGRAGRELPALEPGAGELSVAVLVALARATVEAGIVEEYFFRVLMLERLTRLLRSGAPALVITSLLFGLAHAPGLYLRPELTGESLGEPSVLLAVGYSVVVLSVAGFLFGTLWLRTRNLLLVALLHGLNDCIPAIAGTVHWMRGG
jgi:membrane protease YdiL (CAAX protease family)